MNQIELKKSSDHIKFCMNSHGLSVQQLADLCNCTRVTISRVINGKYPLSDRLAHDMALVFSVSPNYLKGLDDNPGTDNFIASDEWFKRNSQYFYISKVINYLRSFEYSITELVIVNDVEFKQDAKTLKFNTFATKKDLLALGITFEDTDNIDMFVEYECSEDILIEIIKSHNTHAAAHCWEIKFQNIIKRIDEQQFLDIMYSFALLTQNYFGAAIYDFNKSNVKLTDIGMTINKKKQEEIALGTWQPPTEEEQRQKLLHAIYGDNIPDNLKKEE